MPEYDITSPDGKKFRITAPEGATQDEVLAYAKDQFAKMPQEQAPASEQAPSPSMASRVLTDAGKIGMGFLRGGPGGATAEVGKQVFSGLDQAGEVAGGATTDALAKVVPAEVAAGAGTAVKMIPNLLGTKGASMAGAPVMEAAAKGMMQSALKPQAKAILNGDAARAVETLLEQGANVSTAGAVKLRGEINKLSKEIAQMISASPASVDKAHVASEVYKTLQKFRTQVNPGADTKAVLNSWDEFKNLVGNKIPVQEAQALKQGTYKVLADKYDKIGGAVDNEAATQAQMAMARGLRQGIEEAVPGVGQLNAKESALINALEMAERRAGIGGNKDIGGIAWLANNPAAAMAMMADRSAAFKSWLANKLYAARTAAPAGAGAAATGLHTATKE